MKKKFNLLIVIGLVLGIVCGIYLPNIMKNISFIGTIYVNLLKFMIVPIIFTSIMVTIYNSSNEKSNILSKTVLLFIIMFVISFLISSLLVVLINPASNFPITNLDSSIEASSFDISQILINLFPSNIVSMISNNSIFQVIIFAVMCGFCANKIPNSKKVIDVVDGFKNIFFKLLEYIMYLTPLGVFSLIGNSIANYGESIISFGAKYILTAYLISIVVLIVVMILPVVIIAKINPFTYIKKICKIWLITMTTCSSSATLPYTIKVCNEELNIPDKITNIVVPLGCTIHMCGGAVSFSLLGIFCFNLYGINIDFITYLLMIVSSTLINMAAPGIPNGGIVIGATYLSLFGLPLTFIGFYSGIYKILDMIYTTLNVTGDITANVLIDYFNKKKS